MAWKPGASQRRGRVIRDVIDMPEPQKYDHEVFCPPETEEALRELARRDLDGKIIASWNTPSSSKFFLGLEPYKDFSKITKQAFRSAKLNHYYGDVDNLLGDYNSEEVPMFEVVSYLTDDDFARYQAILEELS